MHVCVFVVAGCVCVYELCLFDFTFELGVFLQRIKESTAVQKEGINVLETMPVSAHNSMQTEHFAKFERIEHICKERTYRSYIICEYEPSTQGNPSRVNNVK